MRQLTRKEDPSGFLTLFRHAASMMHGDPSGTIHSRGRWHSPTKKGPGRRHEGARNQAGSKLWGKCPEKRTDWGMPGK